ncbi:integrase [Gossypium australe]|uniref:Integrase n=1 Tax=Gossypium australe TaxID=47621 RepID=A0A5B6WED5_9ROSI|nr:integrase [Gossypium australe]
MPCILVEIRCIKISKSYVGGPIPFWKWRRVTMDFVSGFPLTHTTKDYVWVIMDYLTKFAHFVLVRIDYSL